MVYILFKDLECVIHSPKVRRPYFLRPSTFRVDIPSVSLGLKADGTQGPIEITVNVSHKGRSVFRHVNRAILFADGREIR